MSKDNNLISAGKVDLGLVVDEYISNFKRNHQINADKKILKFRSEVNCFIVSMLSKLFERSPLGSALLKSASVLDPDVLQDNTRDKLITQFKALLKIIMSLSILAANSCDKALSHFKCLLDNDLKELRLGAIEFIQEDERLDDFYFKKVNAGKYTELSFVMIRFILTLCHGQASLERGFNLNNAVLKTVMSPNTIIAKCIIKDHMLSNNVASHTVFISLTMINSFRSAR